MNYFHCFSSGRMFLTLFFSFKNARMQNCYFSCENDAFLTLLQPYFWLINQSIRNGGVAPLPDKKRAESRNIVRLFSDSIIWDIFVKELISFASSPGFFQVWVWPPWPPFGDATGNRKHRVTEEDGHPMSFLRYRVDMHKFSLREILIIQIVTLIFSFIQKNTMPSWKITQTQWNWMMRLLQQILDLHYFSKV